MNIRYRDAFILISCIIILAFVYQRHVIDENTLSSKLITWGLKVKRSEWDVYGLSGWSNKVRLDKSVVTSPLNKNAYLEMPNLDRRYSYILRVNYVGKCKNCRKELEVFVNGNPLKTVFEGRHGKFRKVYYKVQKEYLAPGGVNTVRFKFSDSLVNQITLESFKLRNYIGNETSLQIFQLAALPVENGLYPNSSPYNFPSFIIIFILLIGYCWIFLKQFAAMDYSEIVRKTNVSLLPGSLTHIIISIISYIAGYHIVYGIILFWLIIFTSLIIILFFWSLKRMPWSIFRRSTSKRPLNWKGLLNSPKNYLLFFMGLMIASAMLLFVGLNKLATRLTSGAFLFLLIWVGYEIYILAASVRTNTECQN